MIALVRRLIALELTQADAQLGPPCLQLALALELVELLAPAAQQRELAGDVLSSLLEDLSPALAGRITLVPFGAQDSPRLLGGDDVA